MLLVVREILDSPYAMCAEQGTLVYDKILPVLQQGEKVELDFDGMKFCTAPFWTVAIGQLFSEFSEAEVREKIQFLHLNDLGTKALNRSIESASRFYTNPNYRRAIESIIIQMEEESNQ
ncbi:MAG: STAS-like domain-containing protein [Brasilonema angustatum HA4187-MV1]|jgi:hypothetical protein|nr:STAS-like domain-containing protein [Brasilonema angustatum HA4187-MV1]